MAIKTYVTNKGRALLAKALANGFAISFVSAELGTGTAGTDEQILAYNSLVTKFADAVMGGRNYDGNATCKFSVQYTTSGLSSTAYITEIGIYATDPDDGKILFSYTYFGSDADRLFPNSQASIYRVYDVAVAFSASGVTVTIDPTALIKANQASPTAQAGKLLYVNADGKLPADITGDAATLGGHASSHYAEAGHGHSSATSSQAGFMSGSDKANLDQVVGRVDQSLKQNASPTFAGLTVNGFIEGATFH